MILLAGSARADETGMDPAVAEFYDRGAALIAKPASPPVPIEVTGISWPEDGYDAEGFRLAFHGIAYRFARSPLDRLAVSLGGDRAGHSLVMRYGPANRFQLFWDVYAKSAFLPDLTLESELAYWRSLMTRHPDGALVEITSGPHEERLPRSFLGKHSVTLAYVTEDDSGKRMAHWECLVDEGDLIVRLHLAEPEATFEHARREASQILNGLFREDV